MNSPQNSADLVPSVEPDANSAEPPPRCEAHPQEQMLKGIGTTPWVCAECARIAIAHQKTLDHERLAADARKANFEREQADLERRLGAAGIPPRYLDRTFDTFPVPEGELARKHLSTLRSYSNRFPAMREKGISALLVGGTGTGKTGLACSVANVVVRHHGFTAAFMTAYAAVRHQRDTWGRRGKTEREALDDLLKPDLLILDEVGTSVGGDSELSMLFEVLNNRYEQRRPVMLLSNLPMDDYEAAGVKRPGLRTYLGPRIIDRFRDDGSFTLAMDWPSLRGRRDA